MLLKDSHTLHKDNSIPKVMEQARIYKHAHVPGEDHSIHVGHGGDAWAMDRIKSIPLTVLYDLP